MTNEECKASAIEWCNQALDEVQKFVKTLRHDINTPNEVIQQNAFCCIEVFYQFMEQELMMRTEMKMRGIDLKIEVEGAKQHARH